MTKITRPSLALSAAIILTGGMATAQTTLSLLIDNGPATVSVFEALTAAYTAQNPDITFDIETRLGGAVGDNQLKTRLATGEMNDIFLYNSGSLMQALNPTRTLVDLTDLPNQENVIDSFKTVVEADGKLFGVPILTAMGGGILYNIPLYEELGLSVPKTWDEFMANNAAVLAAGRVPVAQTYGTGATWTSQLFVLADFFNVLAEVPDFAVRYTNNEAKYATTPAAMRGFQYLQDVHEAGFLNPDFGSATFEDGLRMVALGEAAHYPMLSFAIGTIGETYPDHVMDVGFFAQPGPSADSNGLTVWMPAALYIPTTSNNIDEARDFLNWIATVEACDIQTAAIGATGPYLIEGCTLPEDVNNVVADMLPYFQTEGANAPALEFLSPVKGPAMEQITVEVGSGIRDAASAAALYDEDVRKQAQQLGLPNW
ncbi:MAG: extracellular solute-binding protein [Rubellimicrobium sp.]|nr:extracellular solute-binding protein [Rubellimicrobium sp.]